MILFSQFFVAHKVTEGSHVKILFSLSLMVIVNSWTMYEENFFKFWCSAPVLKLSMQEHVRQECPFEAVQNRLSIYLLHVRINSWMMPLRGRQKLPYFLKLPCIHIITVYTQTVRWSFIEEELDLYVEELLSWLQIFHNDTKVAYIVVINTDSPGTGRSFPGGRLANKWRPHPNILWQGTISLQ